MAYMFFPYNPIQIYMYTYMYVPVFFGLYIHSSSLICWAQTSVNLFFWEAVRVFHRRHGFGRSKKKQRDVYTAKKSSGNFMYSHGKKTSMFNIRGKSSINHL